MQRFDGRIIVHPSQDMLVERIARPATSCAVEGEAGPGPSSERQQQGQDDSKKSSYANTLKRYEVHLLALLMTPGERKCLHAWCRDLPTYAMI